MFDWSNNTGAIDVKIDRPVVEEKLIGLFLRAWISYIISIANTASKQSEALIYSMKFFSYEVALYLYESTIRLCIEYYFHVWVATPNYYLHLLDKLEKRLWRTNYAGPDCWICWPDLLVLPLLRLLNLWLIVEMYPA